MIARGRPVTAAVLGGVLALAAGCATGDEGASPVPLDRATGAVLADAADRLAAALEGDDPCVALVEAEALHQRATRALEVGDAPESVVAETIRVVDATTADLSCERDEDGDEPDRGEDPAEADEDPADPEPASDPDPASDPAPTSDPAPADDGSTPSGDDPSDDGDADGGGSGGQGPPGQQRDGDGDRRGPDGEGPPGQNRGGGRG